MSIVHCIVIMIPTVSEALSRTKLKYSKLEKMAYAVVMALWKLKHYFKAHKITVPTTHRVRDIFENCEAICRLGDALQAHEIFIVVFPKSVPRFILNP